MKERALPLYHALLGPAFERLPAPLRRMHTAQPLVTAIGTATVTHGDSRLSRRLGRLLRFPAAGIDRPLTVTFQADAAGELLSRRYPDAVLATRQRPGGPPGSALLRESFGPLVLTCRLEASEAGLDFTLLKVGVRGCPLPRFLWPRLQARERAEADWYRFFVRIDLPLAGRLIQYCGRLRILE